MSAAKHTPGPWFIFGNGHCVGGANTDPTTVAEHPTAGIAMCGMARRDPAECEANARLVAAAPCLLQALRDVLSGAVHYQLHEDEQCVLDARAAILRATGEGA